MNHTKVEKEQRQKIRKMKITIFEVFGEKKMLMKKMSARRQNKRKTKLTAILLRPGYIIAAVVTKMGNNKLEGNNSIFTPVIKVSK